MHKCLREPDGGRLVSIDERTRQGSAIDSSSNYVRCNLLKLLTIVAESGPSGFESVTNALDHVKVIFFDNLVYGRGDQSTAAVL